jgi:hypothetical protein
MGSAFVPGVIVAAVIAPVKELLGPALHRPPARWSYVPLVSQPQKSKKTLGGRNVIEYSSFDQRHIKEKVAR